MVLLFSVIKLQEHTLCKNEENWIKECRPKKYPISINYSKKNCYNQLMVEVQEEREKKVNALLVGYPQREKNSSSKPKELIGLVKTLGMDVAGVFSLTRIEPTPAYGMGSGKAKEIADKAKELFADCIIFDWEIDPTKQRNWEKLCSIPVFDRNEVILRIFASRAQTKEAVLQVELARLTYSLPRLSHMYGDLARQRGGSYGAKGSGETQLELDRRQTEDKIVQIKKELEQVSQNRQTQRKQRERNSVHSCALVGYTNAGKSSLLNALTGSEVFVENKLFATLDPTTRKYSLGEGSSVLLTDTVGFISNLPHTLVNAFRSTLEEASFADLLLITVDSSDLECIKQYKQVLKVLQEIGAEKIPRLVLLNKWDMTEKGLSWSTGEDSSAEGEDAAKEGNFDSEKESGAFAEGADACERIAELNAAFPNAIKLSAKTQEGFVELQQKITENLFGSSRNYVIPASRADLVELARKNGTIQSEEWLEDAVHLKARIPGFIDENGKASTRTLSLLKPYQKDLL